tara:strand:+ start:29481 stop:30134 length:654 start_codon:yes stop_codon:yes gene_type:complete
MGKFKTTGETMVHGGFFAFKEPKPKKIEPSLCLNPTMNSSEIAFLQTYLLKVKSVFEFGCGGSTTFISENKNIKKIHSVDSDINWINVIKKSCPKKTKLHYVDINANPVNWGHPKDYSKIENWPKYSSGLLKIRNFFPDLILVDGRFRVACALKSIERMKKNSYLMIHDYTGGKYNGVEKYLNIIDKSCSLYVFSKKNNINKQELEKDIKRYEYICD